jgi:hypothetical protein
MGVFLLGIPWLATAIGTFFTSTIGFFAAYLTRRIAVVTAVVAVILSLTVAFIAAIEGMISSIPYVAPDFTGAFAIVPGNFSTCVSIMLTAKVLKWAYSWNVALAQIKLF